MTGGSLLRRNRFPYRLFLKVIPLHAVKAVSYEIGTPHRSAVQARIWMSRQRWLWNERQARMGQRG